MQVDQLQPRESWTEVETENDAGGGEGNLIMRRARSFAAPSLLSLSLDQVVLL